MENRQCNGNRNFEMVGPDPVTPEPEVEIEIDWNNLDDAEKIRSAREIILNNLMGINNKFTDQLLEEMSRLRKKLKDIKTLLESAIFYSKKKNLNLTNKSIWGVQLILLKIKTKDDENVLIKDLRKVVDDYLKLLKIQKKFNMSNSTKSSNRKKKSLSEDK